MAYLDRFDTVCDCGNGIDYRDLGDGAECCEWCLPENRFDGIMWRKAVGADWLEQVETHGFDSLYSVERGKQRVSVFANSEEIAEYIADQYLAQIGEN
jgi:hypothetical protein